MGSCEQQSRVISKWYGSKCRHDQLNHIVTETDRYESVLYFTAFVQCHTVRKWSLCLLTFRKANIFCINNDKRHVPTRSVSPALVFLVKTLVKDAGGFRGPLSDCSCCLTSPITSVSFPLFYEQVLCLRQDVFIGMDNSRLSLVLSTPKPKHVELSLILLAFYSFNETWMTWYVCKFDLLTYRLSWDECRSQYIACCRCKIYSN